MTMIPHSPAAPLEQRLIGRVLRGTGIGMAVFAVVGFLLVALATPGGPLLERVGVGLFVGFWSGPIFGASGGVAYHEWKESREENAIVSPVVDIRVVPAAVPCEPISSAA